MYQMKADRKKLRPPEFVTQQLLPRQLVTPFILSDLWVLTTHQLPVRNSSTFLFYLLPFASLPQRFEERPEVPSAAR
jgi:hypothetical protein